jgi:hypothetical protein
MTLKIENGFIADYFLPITNKLTVVLNSSIYSVGHPPNAKDMD